LKGVQRATAISNLPDLAGLTGIFAQLVSPRTVFESIRDDPERIEPIRKSLLANTLVADTLLSADGRTSAVLIQVEAVTGSGIERKHLAEQLREIVARARADHPQWPVVLTGPAITTVDLIDYLHKDLGVFSIFVLILICVSLGLIFRRAAPVLVPTAIAAGSAVFVLGLSIALGMSMSLITQILVTLTAILAVANCVHLIVAYDEFDPGAPRTAAEHTTRQMLGPTFAACATTAAGFGSLGFARLLPFRQFALLMAVGVMFAWLMGICAVSLYGSRRGRRRRPESRVDRGLARLLPRSADISEDNRVVVLIIFGLLTVAGAIGATRLRYESDFLMNFRADSTVRKSYDFLGKYLAPVGSMEVVVTVPEGVDLLTTETLFKVDRLGREVVEQNEAVVKVASIADVCSLGGIGLPTTEIGLRARLALIERMMGRDVLAGFLSADRRALRINFRAREGFQVAEKLALAERVRDRAQEIFGESYGVEVTGIYPFYAHLIDGLLKDQNVCFALAVVAVFGLMWLSIRSLSLAVICMVPNLLPIVFCLGLMGFFEIPVNMATAMILSVSIGIAVDSALHYAWRYRREIRAGHEPRAAMRITHATVGKACVFTHVVVVGGFWVLCLSEFMPTAYFGGLIGVTMIGALLCDLFLLPMMLVHFKPVYKSMQSK
jgi:predicted RND superfamily exporter protein